ncbi:MAG: lyase family protein [Spirochaetia bacterium]|jgi:adenylosuccinate lyase|nr:lyase family protein [Spirochaetia bacterium]
MEARNIFKNLSPLDHRYYLSNRELFESLSTYLSEEAVVKYCIKVESALLETHIQMQMPGSEAIIKQIRTLERTITPEMVYEEEENTQHNIRALVNVMKLNVPDKVSHFVHLGATSVDILDTAAALRMRDASRKVVLPALIDLMESLLDIADREAGTPQVGRTHGQHAVPVTLGFSFAEYIARLGKSILKLEELSVDLRGKLAGAVGAYNATSLLVKDPIELETKFLSLLDLKAAEYSTQMVEPEYLLRLLLEMNVAFGIIANLADDLRHLQRTEIDELRELFTNTQVGSSTMPQKRNPWNSEHVKSLWKAFFPRVMTFYMDQISEHQRDMSNSASSRFIADYISGFVAAIARMNKIVTTIRVDRKRLLENITLKGDLVLAEAAYVLLSLSGDTDAHEKIRKITLECEANGTRLVTALQDDPELWNYISTRLKLTTGEDAKEFFSNPQKYSGKAADKTKKLVFKYRREMIKLKEIL